MRKVCLQDKEEWCDVDALERREGVTGDAEYTSNDITGAGLATRLNQPAVPLVVDGSRAAFVDAVLLEG
jgi:hypothetical protein